MHEKLCFGIQGVSPDQLVIRRNDFFANPQRFRKAMRKLARKNHLPGHSLSLESFHLIMRLKTIDDFVDLAFHHFRKLIKRQTDAMIRETPLRKVIGANSLAAIAGSDHASCERRCELSRPLAILEIEKPRAKNFHRFVFVLELRSLVLANDDKPRRIVRDTNRGVGRIDALTAGAAGAKHIDSKIHWVDIHVDFFGLGQNRDRHGRGVNPALSFSLGNTLDAMHAASHFRRLKTRFPEISAMISLKPPRPVGLAERSSTRQPCRSAKR